MERLISKYKIQEAMSIYELAPDVEITPFPSP
jgi:hypothetical protein